MDKKLFKILGNAETMKLVYHDYCGERHYTSKEGEKYTKHLHRFLDENNDFIEHYATVNEHEGHKQGDALMIMKENQKVEVTRSKYGFFWKTLFTHSLSQ